MIIREKIVVTPDCPTIVFREAQEVVDLPAVLPRVLYANGWEPSTFFHVCFMNREETRLLSHGHFVVVAKEEQLRTTEENPFQPITKAVSAYQYQQLGAWYVAEHEAPDAVEMPSEGVERRIQMGRVKYNKGREMYDIFSGEAVVWRTKDRGEAERIARGEIAIPSDEIPEAAPQKVAS